MATDVRPRLRYRCGLIGEVHSREPNYSVTSEADTFWAEIAHYLIFIVYVKGSIVWNEWTFYFYSLSFIRFNHGLTIRVV